MSNRFSSIRAHAHLVAPRTEALRTALAGTAMIAALLLSTGCATQGATAEAVHGGHSDGSIGASNRNAGNERVVIRPNSTSNPNQDGLPPSADIPPDLMNSPDAVPKLEAKSAFGNPTSYEVYGQKYVVLTDARGFKERGQASWYGKKFHGKLTSSGEPYDMYKMTAAHKTLPIPCYARVTNLTNNRSVVVRINDRGPFHTGRIVDLSYTAALRLGLIGDGSAPVELEVLTPGMNAPPPVMMANNTVPKAAPVTAQMGPVPEPSTAAAPSPPPSLKVPVQVAAKSPDPGLQMASAMDPRPDESRAAADAASLKPVSMQPASIQSGGGSVMPVPGPPRFLQTGLFGEIDNAATMRDQLLKLGISNVQIKSEVRGASYIHRVLVGPYADAGLIEIMHGRLAEVHMDSVPVAQ